MREREIKPLAPRRKELPCDFAVSKGTRTSTLVRSAFVIGLGGLAASCGGAVLFKEGLSEGDLLSWGFLVVGLVFVAGGAWLAMTAFDRVRIDEQGLVVRRLGRSRQVPWTDVRSIAFGARRTKSYVGGHGAARLVVRAALDAMNEVRDEDPYYFGRVRPQFEPSAVISTSRGGEELTDTLGWGFFLALYAEADARGIEIVRTS